MVTFFESIIGDGITYVIGDQTIIGVLFLGFFAAFVALQGTRFDVKVLVMVPVIILATVYIPLLAVLLPLGLAFIIHAAFTKLDNR